ncbi:MAG: cytosolic protein [Trueperaceae bacterium]|nr:cytosolic protein [Trueperaceae bacterium]
MTHLDDARDLRLGAVDMHVHAAPDVKPRVMDAIDVATAAREAGMRGLVLKDHAMVTADRASLAAARVPGVDVVGSITLNRAVGGLNPYAVEAAIRYGARVVWFPTNTAASHLRARGKPFGDGLSIFEGGLDAPGRVRREVEEICNLIANAGVVLATGHLHAVEVAALVPFARALGVDRVVVTHPENRAVALDGEGCLAATRAGAYLELCYRSTVTGAHVPVAHLAGIVRDVGADRCILATDLGAADLEPPARGMLRFIREMLGCGIPAVDVSTMVARTPVDLLGLDRR